MPKTITDEQILEAALSTIAEHGYAGATTRQIASAAGVNEVTLFRKFGSKANLLREAMLRELSVFERSGGARYTGDLVADLERIVGLYHALIERRGSLMPMIFAELRRRPELGEVLKIPLRMILSVAEVLARYQREQVLQPEPPLQAVAALFGPLLIAGMLRGYPVVSPGFPSTAEHVRRFVDGRALR